MKILIWQLLGLPDLFRRPCQIRSITQRETLHETSKDNSLRTKYMMFSLTTFLFQACSNDILRSWPSMPWTLVPQLWKYFNNETSPLIVVCMEGIYEFDQTSNLLLQYYYSVFPVYMHAPNGIPAVVSGWATCTGRNIASTLHFYLVSTWSNKNDQSSLNSPVKQNR